MKMKHNKKTTTDITTKKSFRPRVRGNSDSKKKLSEIYIPKNYQKQP